jgi:hypothetical protein
MSDYIKQLEQQNEELKQKLAYEQAKSHGMVTLSWTNWHPRYDDKMKLMYYQTVLTSYCTHFAFARITGDLKTPELCNTLCVEIHKWSEHVKIEQFERKEFVHLDALKEIVQNHIKETLFKNGNIQIIKKKSNV